MKNIHSTPLRLGLGLTFLTLGLLVVGYLTRAFTEESIAGLDARERLRENLEWQLSLAVSPHGGDSIQRIIELLVEKHRDVRFAAYRTAEGKIIARAGDRELDGNLEEDGMSTAAWVEVPVFDEAGFLGTAEVAFATVQPDGWMGPWTWSTVRTVGFLTSAGVLACLLFFRARSRHLDLASAIPSAVQNALDLLTEGVVLLDRQGKMVFVNSSFAQKAGVCRGSLVGRQIADLAWVRPTAESGAVELSWLRSAQRGRTIRGVTTTLDGGPEGRRRLVVNSCPVSDDRGTVTGQIATFDDMTEIESKNARLNQSIVLLKKSRDEVSRKNRVLERTNQLIEAKVAERTAELRRSKEAAEAADRAKSAFLANISHELRTPMHAILSFSRFGITKLGQVPPEKLRGYFEAIQESGTNLLILLNDLLDVSKLQAGKMEYDMRTGDLVAEIPPVIAEFEATALERSVRIELQVDAAGTLCSFDAFRIKQVIRNLLSNAIKFTHEGTRILITVCEGEKPLDSEDAPVLEVAVADEGIGVPENELESVFQPFAQSRRTDLGAGGTGLGLAICRQIVEEHGGWIRAGNRRQGGAVFTFGIPLVAEQEPVTG